VGLSSNCFQLEDFTKSAGYLYAKKIFHPDNLANDFIFVHSSHAALLKIVRNLFDMNLEILKIINHENVPTVPNLDYDVHGRMKEYLNCLTRPYCKTENSNAIHVKLAINKTISDKDATFGNWYPQG